MQAVKDIEGVADEVGKAIVSTQSSLKHETELVSGMAIVTSEISSTKQQQQVSTEQVMGAMDQFVEVTDDVAQGSEQVQASADDLGEVAEGLIQIVERLSGPRGSAEP